MSGINIVRNLQVLYYSKKKKEIKNLKNEEKLVVRYRQLYILLMGEPNDPYKKLTQGGMMLSNYKKLRERSNICETPSGKPGFECSAR